MEISKKFRNVVPLVFNTSFDAGELRWHMMGIHDWKQTIEGTGDEKLARDGFNKEVLKKGKALSVSAAGLKKEDVLKVLRKKITTSFSQNVFFNSKVVSKEMGHFFGFP